MLFNKQQLRALLIPLVIEQVLTGLMGVADTLMVSNVGETAISGVSLVDAINQALSEMKSDGTFDSLVSQYIEE